MKDLLLNDNGDIDISNIDVVIADSDLQHQEHILITHKGQLKHKPDAGVGIENFLRSSDLPGFLSEVNSEFTKDGMQVRKLNYDEENGNLDYDAGY